MRHFKISWKKQDGLFPAYDSRDEILLNANSYCCHSQHQMHFTFTSPQNAFTHLDLSMKDIVDKGKTLGSKKVCSVSSM